MATLVDIVNQVNVSLTAWYAAQSPPQTLYTGLGRSAIIALDKAPPAVIWVPTNDTYEGPQGYQGTSKAAPRSLRQRVIGVDAWLWAAVAPGVTEDFNQLEVLINATIGAVHQNLLGAYRVNGGSYQGMDDQEPQAFGRVYVLHFSFLSMVPELLLPAGNVVTVTSLPQTTQTGPFPDGQTVTPNP